MSVRSLDVAIGGDLSGLERAIARASSVVDRFTSRAAQAGNTFDSGFGASITRTTQQVGQSIDGLNNRIALLTQKRSLVFDTATITRTSQEIGDLQARVRQLQGLGSPVPSVPPSASAGLASYATGLLSIGAALSAAKAGIGIIADLNRLDLKLQAVSTSTADFAHDQAFLQSTSDKLGLSYQTLAGSYVGLKASAEGTNLAGSKTDAIFEAIVRRGAKLGLSNEQVQGSLLAVGQMMSKGTVAAEELRGQLGERLPGAFNAMARALGVTTSELGKMLQAGDVLAEDALPKLAAELQKTSDGAERNATTIVGGTARMTNQFQLLIAEFGKTAGVDTFFAKITGGLAEFARGARQINKDLPNGILQTNEEAASKSRQLEKFAGYSPARRRANIDILNSDITEGQTNLDSQVGGGTITRSGRALAVALDQKRQLVRELRRENIKLLIAERGGAAGTAADVATTNDPIKNLERLEKRQDALTKKRKAILAQGGKFEGKDAAELADITERFARSDKPKKARETKGVAAKDNYLSSVDLFAKDLGELNKKIVDDSLAGKIVSAADVARAQGLAHALQEADRYKTHLLGLQNPATIKNIEELSIKGGGKNGKGITGDGATVIRGVPTKTTGIDAGKIFEQARELLANKEASKNDFTAGGSTLIDQLAAKVGGKKQLLALAAEIREGSKTVEQALTEFETATKGKENRLNDAMSQTFQSMGDAIGAGANPLKAGLQTILEILGGYLVELGEGILLTGSLEALAGIIPGLQGLAISGATKLAVGGGLIVGGAAVRSIGARAFADGGLVYGPTLSYTGEYAGAKNNPEVIAPLSKLKSMLGDTGGGSTTIAVGGSLRGQDLRLQAVRAGNYSRTFGA